jgi:hypothetical protein
MYVKATEGLVQQHLPKSGAVVVKETFRLRINISDSFTGWCSESPASSPSSKTLSVTLKRTQSVQVKTI